MFEDYVTEVRELYESKKATGELSMNLTHPTCAKLRNECAILFKKQNTSAERTMLRSFFERSPHEELNMNTIRRFDPDKFRPLCNFLKKKIRTLEKNIELLAWLIDFKPRPYINYSKRTEKQGYYGGNSMLGIEIGTELPDIEKILFPSALEKHALEWNNERGELELFALNKPYYTSFLKTRRRNSSKKSQPNYESALASMELTDKSLSETERTCKKVLLEYPSGVKLTVDTTDIDLIATLVRL